MIYPSCSHKAPTKSNPDGNMPRPTGWILTCSPHYEAAVRLNMVDYADAMKAVALEQEVARLKGQIQDLESDNHDMRNARQTTFLRCECGRLREKGLMCQGCSRC